MSPSRPDLVECWLFRIDAAGRPEILLIRRAPGRIFSGIWQCVTGKLEPGERIVAGAFREVVEETGLDAAALEAVYDTDIINWFHEETSDAIWCEAVFAARVSPAAVPVLSDEHDDLRWVTPDEARGLVVWPAYLRAIEVVEGLVANPERAETSRLLLDSSS